MSTKLVGDIAVQHAILEALKRGWGVLMPLGDRLPYDIVFDVGGRLVRVQVKSAFPTKGGWYIANTRRCKTNRKRTIIDYYGPDDFDFALIWHPGQQVFYVMPIAVFLTFRSAVTLTGDNPQRKRTNRATEYRDAWESMGSTRTMYSA